MYVSSSLHLVRFGQLLRCADKRIVNIMKVYIERNNMQVEFSNINHLGSVSDSLGRLASANRSPTQHHIMNEVFLIRGRNCGLKRKCSYLYGRHVENVLYIIHFV